jgi:hypothetical protein
VPALAFVVPFVAYWATMSTTWALDTLYAIDGAEMVIAARTLGIDHPPSHPLYLTAAHLFSRLPFESPDTGVILTSVVFGAFVPLFLFLAIRRATESWLSSLVAGWIVAFGFVFWVHATIAEVYAIQLAFMSLVIYLGARWWQSRGEGTLGLFFLALGLCATTNLLLAVLLVPPIVFLTVRGGAWYSEGTWEGRTLARSLGLGLVGLLPFAYIPIRLTQQPEFVSDFVYLNGFEVQSVRWYWWYLTGEEFTSDQILRVPLITYPMLVWQYVRSLAANCSPAAPALGLVGVGSLALSSIRRRRERQIPEDSTGRKSGRRTRRARSRRAGVVVRLFTRSRNDSGLFGAFLLVLFATTCLPVLSYQVPDRDVFYMPSFLALSALAGLGFDALRRLVASRWERAGQTAVHLAGLAIPVYLFVTHYPGVTAITQDDTTYHQRQERFENLPQDAIIISEDDGRATRYKYFQIVKGLRPDVTVHTLGRLAPRFRGELDLARSLRTEGDLRLALNVADRLRILNALFDESGDRPIYAVLDDRMPPEFDHFRTVRSPIDPQLLSVQRKPPAEASADPLPVVVRAEGSFFEDVRFLGFDIAGLDQGISRAFGSPLAFGPGDIDGIVRRGELFEVSFVVQRTGSGGSKLFAEFAFVNDRLEIPSAHGFSAAKHLEVVPVDLPQGWFRKDRFILKIPGYVPGGLYTLAAKVNRATGQIRGTYQGKPVEALEPLAATTPWKGQSEYRPLGRIWVE